MARKKTPPDTAPKPVSGLAQELLDAQITFLLSRFEPAAYRVLVGEEVRQTFAWLAGARLSEVAREETVLNVIRRNVVEMPISGGLTELIGEMSRLFLTSSHNTTATLEDIFPRRIFLEMTEKALSLEVLRRNIIHRALYNTAFPRLIADVLFYVLRQYILAENALARKVPGLNVLFFLWRGAVSMAWPGLETSIENRIRNFVEEHIEYVLQQSERFLTEFLNAERLAEIAEDRFDEASRHTLARQFKALGPYDLDDFIVIGYEFWLSFRKTGYFRKIYTEMVRYFFDKYGDREVDVLIEDLGITPDMIITEILELTGPPIAKLLASGYLEGRLRLLLSDFFGSGAVQTLLEKK
jgi:hypothetical protein